MLDTPSAHKRCVWSSHVNMKTDNASLTWVLFLLTRTMHMLIIIEKLKYQRRSQVSESKTDVHTECAKSKQPCSVTVSLTLLAVSLYKYLLNPQGEGLHQPMHVIKVLEI